MYGSHFIGKQNPDSQTFSDEYAVSQFNGQPHKIQEIIVAFTHQNVVGLQAVYVAPGSGQVVKGAAHFGKEQYNCKFDTIRFNNDEYLIEIFGRHGDIYDQIGFRTSTGASYQFGGQGGNHFDMKAPYGQHFNVLRGGLGGHLHYTDLISAQIQQSYGGYQQQGYQQQGYQQQGYQQQGYQGSQTFTQNGVTVTLSSNNNQSGYPGQNYQQQKDEFFRGKTHNDTSSFSDVDLVRNLGNFKIESISIYTTGANIIGLGVKYCGMNSGQRVNSKHVGKEYYNNNVQEKRFDLQNGEYITEIYGRHGDIIDFIGFATNFGNRFEAGGSGGNYFSVKAPQNRHFSVLRGGLGGHIHNIDFNTEWIPNY